MSPDTLLLPEKPIEGLGPHLAEGGAASEYFYIGESGLWRLRLRDGGWEEPALQFPAIWQPAGGMTFLPGKAISAVAYRGRNLWYVALEGEKFCCD